MNIQLGQQNLLIKKHNRKIIDKAYRKSEMNFNYQFPKKLINDEKLLESDSISLVSGSSEVYDLHLQNKFLFTQQSANINSVSQRKSNSYRKNGLVRLENIIKCKQKRKWEDSTARQNSNSKNKNKYLSLTPQKQNNVKSLLKISNKSQFERNQTQYSSERQDTIKKQKIQKHYFLSQNKKLESDSFTDQILFKLKEIAHKCMQKDEETSNRFQRFQKTEATFSNQKIEFNRQTFMKRNNQQTTDSTPQNNKQNQKDNLNYVVYSDIKVSGFNY